MGRRLASVVLACLALGGTITSAQPAVTPSPALIYRCSGNCKGLWWDEYRHRPLRVQQYWQPDRLPDGRVGSAYGGCFLEAIDDAGNRTETLGEWGGPTNVALDLFFVDGGNKLIIVSTDGGDSCATTTVNLHDLHWPSTRSEVLLEASEVMCDRELVRGEHPGALHLPVVGQVVPSEDGRLLANSFSIGYTRAKTQLVDLDARKVVAVTDGTLIGRVGARSFCVVEPIYTDPLHDARDFDLKEFSAEGVKKLGRGDATAHVVRGSGGRLLFGAGISKVDGREPRDDTPGAQVPAGGLKTGLYPTPPGYVRPVFPCQVLEHLNAWQEASGTLVVAVEERCNEKGGYALYRLPTP